MALLPILEFPDPRLRTVAKPVGAVNGRIKQLINDMFETMYDAPGIGLAATQVDVHEQIIVMDISEDRDQPRVFINPAIEVLDPVLGDFTMKGVYRCPDFLKLLIVLEPFGSQPLTERAWNTLKSSVVCLPFACNMKSTISKASSLLTICHR